MLRKAIDAGYAVTLIYIGLANAVLAGDESTSASRAVDTTYRVSDSPHATAISRKSPRGDLVCSRRRALRQHVVDEPYRRLATFANATLTMRASGAIPRWAKDIIPTARRKR